LSKTAGKPRKPKTNKKLRKPIAKEKTLTWLMQRAQQKFPPPAAQTKKTAKAKQKFPQPQQKHFPATAHAKSCESQTNNCASQTKPNKKKNRASSTKHFSCRHRSNK
jgi:hypothetical protein